MSIAQSLNQRRNEKGIQRSRTSVYAIAMDDHNVHCMTEDMLDAWWASLTPEEKAVAFEADLNGVLDETIALAHPNVSAFEAFSQQFFEEMKRIQKSPFTGLTREVAHANL